MLRDFTKEKFDIIILAGQSNAVGNGMGTVDKPYQPSEDVWFLCGPLETQEYYFYPACEEVRDNETVGNFILKFSENYIADGRLKEGRKLLILCAAAGGTGFINGTWRMTECYYLRMMDMIRTSLSLNSENKLVGFMWHQGEFDACYGATFDIHYNHLMTMLKSVLDEFDAPEIPFVAGDFVHDWKNKKLEDCIPVVDAMKKVCSDYPYGEFVESDGLTSNFQQVGRKTPVVGEYFEDDIHFSRKALYELGDRYYKAYTSILNRK